MIDADPRIAPLKALWTGLMKPFMYDIQHSGLDIAFMPLDRIQEGAFMHASIELKKANNPDQKLLYALFACGQIAHAKDVLDVYGIKTFSNVFKTMINGSMKNVLERSTDIEAIRTEIAKLDTSMETSSKMKAATQIITDFMTSSPGAKVMVFSSLRESVFEIVAALSTVRGVKPASFIGQGSSDHGMILYVDFIKLQRRDKIKPCNKRLLLTSIQGHTMCWYAHVSERKVWIYMKLIWS